MDLNDKTKFRGFKLFKESHVQDLSAAIVNNTCHVRGKCLPEMKKDRIYSLDLYINVNNSIITGAKCTCPAVCGPTGSYKHIATLAFALKDFVRIQSRIANLQDDTEEVSCTSLLQQWNKPRKRRLDSKNGREHPVFKTRSLLLKQKNVH